MKGTLILSTTDVFSWDTCLAKMGESLHNMARFCVRMSRTYCYLPRINMRLSRIYPMSRGSGLRSDHQYLPPFIHIVEMERVVCGPEFNFISTAGHWQQGKVLPEVDGLNN